MVSEDSVGHNIMEKKRVWRRNILFLWLEIGSEEDGDVEEERREHERTCFGLRCPFQ